MEDELRKEHSGRYALLYDAELIDVFHDKDAARFEAAKRFPEGEFAISPAIGAEPEDLGALGLMVAPVGI